METIEAREELLDGVVLQVDLLRRCREPSSRSKKLLLCLRAHSVADIGRRAKDRGAYFPLLNLKNRNLAGCVRLFGRQGCLPSIQDRQNIPYVYLRHNLYIAY